MRIGACDCRRCRAYYTAQERFAKETEKREVLMEVTGYKLREGIRRWTTRREMASKKFKEHLFRFEGEDKNAAAVASEYAIADANVAILEDAQQRYNQKVVMAIVGYGTISLSLAVKKVGGAGRYEKMWREAVTDTGGDRYSIRGRNERSKDNEYANKTVSDVDALEHADAAAKRASDLRAGIALANSTELDIEGIAEELFA